MNYGTKTVWLMRLHLKEERCELWNKNGLARETTPQGGTL